MTLGEEAVRSIRAVLRLARRDESALGDFNVSLEGFWRSFCAAWIVAPLHFALSYYEYGLTVGQHGAGMTRYFLVDTVAYVLTWTLWPLLMFYATRRMGCGDRFVHYIVVYNWVQVPAMVLLMAAVFGLGRLLGPGGAELIYYLVLGAILLFEWWLAMKTLQISPLAALAVEAGAYLYVDLMRTVERFVLSAGPAAG
jgi:hypothetical protein